MDLKTITLITLTLLETCLFGGLLNGWSSLVYVFKQSGIFGDMCNFQTNTSNNTELNNSVDSSTHHGVTTSASVDVSSNFSLPDNVYSNKPHFCAEQDVRLNLLFSIALAASNICIVFIGIADSRCGTKITRTIFMVMFTTGALLIAFTSQEMPWMILPGLFFVAIGGFSLLLTNVRVSFQLKHGSAVYIGVLNGCFDTSAVMQWLVKVLYENGISICYSYIGIAIIHIVINVTTTILHPKTDVKHSPSKHISNQGEDICSSELSSNKWNVEAEVKERKEKTEKDFSLKRSMFIPMYSLHICWFTIVSLKFFYFIGSINYRLEVILMDNYSVGYFTNVLAYTMVGGIVMSFIAGSLCEWQKQCFKGTSEVKSRLMPQILPLCICSTLTVLVSGLELSTEPNMLYAIFILMVILRGFVFAVNMEFLASVYPPKYVTLLVGLNSTVSGALSLFQYGLFSWNESYYLAPYHVSGLLLTLGIISFGHPVNTFAQANREIPQL